MCGLLVPKEFPRSNHCQDTRAFILVPEKFAVGLLKGILSEMPSSCYPDCVIDQGLDLCQNTPPLSQTGEGTAKTRRRTQAIRRIMAFSVVGSSPS